MIILKPRVTYYVLVKRTYFFRSTCVQNTSFEPALQNKSEVRVHGTLMYISWSRLMKKSAVTWCYLKTWQSHWSCKFNKKLLEPPTVSGIYVVETTGVIFLLSSSSSNFYNVDIYIATHLLIYYTVSLKGKISTEDFQ